MRKPIKVFIGVILLFSQTFCSKKDIESQASETSQLFSEISAGAHYCQPNSVIIRDKSKLVFAALYPGFAYRIISKDVCCILISVDTKLHRTI